MKPCVACFAQNLAFLPIACLSRSSSHSSVPHIKSWGQMSLIGTRCFMHIQRSLSPHNNPVSDTCHFEYKQKRRSKQMITAVCLGCSVATQPNFGSTALIAYMWNEITPHSVGGLRNHFFFHIHLHFKHSDSVSNTSPFFFFISLFPCCFIFLLRSTFTAVSPTHSLSSLLFLRLNVLTGSMSTVTAKLRYKLAP